MGGLTSVEGQGLVLASGGIDSSTLIGLAVAEDMPVSALFVDYGQAAANAEGAAVQAICSHYGVCLRTASSRGMRFGGGEIRGRNAFLLHTALINLSWTSGSVLLGLHAGTGYRDCSPEFVQLMQRSFDFHTGGSVVVTAPFIDWSKLDVYRLALEADVPVHLTYSCDSGNVVCGTCASCRDREGLGRS